MQKTLKKYMLISFWMFFFQLAILTSLFILYIIEKKEIMVTSLIVALGAFLFIDLIFIWIMLSNISKSRIKNDVKAVDIIGDDIQDVYNFAKIGLVLIDDKGSVIWVNDWFEDEQIDLVDSNVFEWKSELNDLVSGEENVTVEHNNRTYEVKFLKDANLFIFKDITEFNAITIFSKAHAPVIGLITIDNYQDMATLVDDVKANDVLTSIQKIIVNYAKKFNLLIRKYRSDSYLIYGSYEQYEKMLEDKFSLINEVREENEDEDYE